MMTSVMNPFRSREGGDEFKSNNLWVGSLTPDTTEADLTEFFGRYGEVERITAYSSRSFAFIYYRHVEEAVAAKENLQGANLNGSSIKIEFARPAKPCKSLWVGGLSPNVSKEDLESEFRKFGEIQDFRFLRERRTAFIDYYESNDAIQARSMNGKRLGSSYLRVDFLRSQAPPRKEQQWNDNNRNVKPPYHPNNSHERDDQQQPSKVLLIGYPPSVQIDEQLLHNSMILFGEIERKKSYPSRHYSLVEFRSVEEARRAKEGLQGRLFKDPRINIMYSNDEMPPPDEDDYTVGKRSRPDNGANWRRLSPNGAGNGILPSPSGPGILPYPGSWEGGYDPSSQLDRESKRTRRDGSVDGNRPIRDSDYIWRGMIAKGGTPVCCARCVPIGKGIETKLPEVVNCSARTGLDMLAKHYTEAVGFEIVFFLPDSEEDFASYTEFLRYLGSKNRAGVAKLDDGTTLFLVPPSDFLTDILNVTGPERLYGVVLKLAPPPVAPSYRQERENYNAPSKPSVSLTPELLATLASFLPATSQPTAAPESMSASSTIVSAVPQSNGLYDHSNQSYQQYGNQYNTPAAQLPPPPPPRYPNMQQQYQGQSVNMPNIPHNNNYAMYSQPMAQQYQPEVSVTNQNYGYHHQQANYNGQVHNLNPSQYQPQAENSNLEPQSQSVISGGGHGGAPDGEVDKDQRYQSTLQFAANLLLQIQQKQQASGISGGQGP